MTKFRLNGNVIITNYPYSEYIGKLGYIDYIDDNDYYIVTIPESDDEYTEITVHGTDIEHTTV